MDKFFALSAPLRREILSLLASDGQLSATMIAKKFRVSAPAISQHLKVLLDSDLVQMQRQAQQRLYQLNPLGLKELESWAEQLMQQIIPSVEQPADISKSAGEA